MLEAKAKDTSASALQKQKKKVFTKIFQALHEILTIQKVVLFSSRGQANFRGLEASRPRTSKCVLEDSTSGNCHVSFNTRFMNRNHLSDFHSIRKNA